MCIRVIANCKNLTENTHFRPRTDDDALAIRESRIASMRHTRDDRLHLVHEASTAHAREPAQASNVKWPAQAARRGGRKLSELETTPFLPHLEFHFPSRLTVPRSTSTAYPPTRTLVMRSPSRVARTYISLGRRIAPPCRMTTCSSLSAILC